MKELLRRVSRVSVWDLLQGYRRRKAQVESRRRIADYLRTHSMKKLHVGAGGAAIEGWLNVDIQPQNERVVFLDATAAYPVPDGTFDYVFSEHLMEHLSLEDQARMLAEVRRTLKPGGIYRVATPDLDAILDLRGQTSDLAREYREWSASVHYPGHVAKLGEGAKGDAFLINNYMHNWGHRFVHSESSLRLLLGRAGFRAIKRVRVHESTHRELQQLEQHGTHIPARFNELETMVLEGER
jgi:predicted SAM-dependent methyltransferase